MTSFLKKFFAPAKGSIQGFINPDDLYRSILTCLGSATAIGVVLAVLQALLANVGVLFPNPTVAALATALLTLVIDLLRRQNQGPTPIPSPTPIPIPSPSPAPANV